MRCWDTSLLPIRNTWSSAGDNPSGIATHLGMPMVTWWAVGTWSA